MNIAKIALVKYKSIYCEYVNSLTPVLGDKIKYIDYKHVFNYDNEDLLNYVTSLIEDKYLNKDPDFKTYYSYDSGKMRVIEINYAI